MIRRKPVESLKVERAERSKAIRRRRINAAPWIPRQRGDDTLMKDQGLKPLDSFLVKDMIYVS
jgi:hypothetical protein